MMFEKDKIPNELFRTVIKYHLKAKSNKRLDEIEIKDIHVIYHNNSSLIHCVLIVNNCIYYCEFEHIYNKLSVYTWGLIPSFDTKRGGLPPGVGLHNQYEIKGFVNRLNKMWVVFNVKRKDTESNEIISSRVEGYIDLSDRLKAKDRLMLVCYYHENENNRIIEDI